MGSVRERIERESREAPEITVPTRDRRTALTSNPTMSTRMQADFAASQNEVTVRSTERTTAASCDFGNGDSFSRVRDRIAVTEAMKPEVARPKTASQLAADAGLAEYNRIQERKAQEERDRLAKIAARKKQQADEKAATERKAKQAQIQFQENAVIREASDLDDNERQQFWERVTAIGAGLDAGAASIIAEGIRASRVQED